MTLRCVVATANPDKAMEIVAIMSQVGDVELLARPGDIGEIEETGDTLLEKSMDSAEPRGSGRRATPARTPPTTTM